MLGFRSLCDNYEEILELRNIPQLRIADLSMGKAQDDGYRGVHVYKKDYDNAMFKRQLEAEVGYEKIQLVTISRPSAYGEYEPYSFVTTKEEFKKHVLAM